MGAHAEYICLRGKHPMAIVPSNMTYDEAAGIPLGGINALHFLRKAKIQPGQKVLIVGASGGVGTYSVQLAKAFGGDVTGVASTSKLDLVRSIGADHVIDYTQDDFADGTQSYDLILDIGGNSTLSRPRSAHPARGTLVTAGGQGGGWRPGR